MRWTMTRPFRAWVTAGLAPAAYNELTRGLPRRACGRSCSKWRKRARRDGDPPNSSSNGIATVSCSRRSSIPRPAHRRRHIRLGGKTHVQPQSRIRGERLGVAARASDVQTSSRSRVTRRVYRLPVVVVHAVAERPWR
jgi:hypothetical protein